MSTKLTTCIKLASGSKIAPVALTVPRLDTKSKIASWLSRCGNCDSQHQHRLVLDRLLVLGRPVKRTKHAGLRVPSGATRPRVFSMMADAVRNICSTTSGQFVTDLMVQNHSCDSFTFDRSSAATILAETATEEYRRTAFNCEPIVTGPSATLYSLGRAPARFKVASLFKPV
jgi:hypothetical protein